MKLQMRFCLTTICVVALMAASAPSAQAGLFAKWCKKSSCCEPAPEPECCCEPDAEPEPVCCEPEPTAEPECCEPEPVECCTSSFLPELAEGEVLLSISPLPHSTATETAPVRLAAQSLLHVTKFATLHTR